MKKSCLPLTIDLIFLLEIKLIRGETEEKKIRVSSSFLFLGVGGLGVGVILSTSLVHMLHKFEKRKKKLSNLKPL